MGQLLIRPAAGNEPNGSGLFSPKRSLQLLSRPPHLSFEASVTIRSFSSATGGPLYPQYGPRYPPQLSHQQTLATICRRGSCTPLKSRAVASSNATVSLFSADLRSTYQMSGGNSSSGSAPGWPSRYLPSVRCRISFAPTRSSKYRTSAVMKPPTLPTDKVGVGWAPCPDISKPSAWIGQGEYSLP